VSRRETYLEEMGLGPVWRLREKREPPKAPAEPQSAPRRPAPQRFDPVPGIKSTAKLDPADDRAARILKMEWPELKAAVKACEACGLRKTCNQTVFGVGDEQADWLLVGEAPGWRGARVSGLPFTSERQLTGTGPAEATATIVQDALAELELDALCWNVVPTHPGTARSNRRPTGAEVSASRPFLEELSRQRRVVAVGRLAERVTGAPYVRHPSYGGAAAFRAGLLRFRPGGRPSSAFLFRSVLR